MLIYTDIKNIKSIKYLRKLENTVKNEIRSNKRKPDIIKENLQNIQNEIDKSEKSLKIQNNNILRKYKVICSNCNKRFKNAKELNSHRNHIDKINKRKLQYCDYTGVHLVNDFNYVVYNLKETSRKIKKKLDNLTQENKTLQKWLIEINDRIKSLTIRCSVCNKLQDDQITKINCSNEHYICQNCIDENCIDDDVNNCPVCFDIINMKKCPICMSFKNDMKDLPCKNTHPYKICESCFLSVISVNPFCPFCRERIE